MVIYESMVEAAEVLPPQQRALLYYAAVEYVEYGNMPQRAGIPLSDAALAILLSHKGLMESQRKKMTGRRRGVAGDSELQVSHVGWQLFNTQISSSGSESTSFDHSDATCVETVPGLEGHSCLLYTSPSPRD